MERSRCQPYPRAERKFRKGASLFSGFLKPEGPPTNAAFKNVTRRELSRQKRTPSQPTETYNEGNSSTKRHPPSSRQKHITREDQLAGPNRTANPLPEVRGSFRLLKLPVSPLKLPFHPTFEILHLPAGTFRSDARRKPSPLMRLSRRTGIWRR